MRRLKSSTHLSNMLKQNVNRVPILRNIKQRWSKIDRVTYVGFRRDAHDFKMCAIFRFGFRIMHIGIGSCRPSFWPKVQEALNVVTLNENALVFWWTLVRKVSDPSILQTKIVQKPHLTTRAKFQLRSTHFPLPEDNVQISGRNLKRYLGASAAPRESNVDPRPCEITSGDKDDIPHVVDSTPKSLSDSETVVDILEDPAFEITMCGGLLPVCREREI